MILDTALKSMRFVLTEPAAVSPCDIIACFADNTATEFVPHSNNLVSNGTTAVVAVPAPAAGVVRQVNEVRLFNRDTISHGVTLQLDNNGTIAIISAGTIAPGDSFLYTPQSGAASGGSSLDEWNAGTVDVVGLSLAVHTATLDLAPVAPGHLFANVGTGTAVPTDVSTSGLFDVSFGTIAGEIATRNGSLWAGLLPGTAGQVLKSTGTASALAYANEQWNAGSINTIGPGLTIVGGTTLDATGTGGGVVAVVAGRNLTGGTITSTGTIDLQQSPTIGVTAGTLPMIINGDSAAPESAATVNALVQIAGQDSVNAVYLLDGYGGTPQFTGRRAQGTRASPTTVNTGAAVLGFAYSGWDGSAYSVVTNMLTTQADQDWAPGAHGCRINFNTVPNGGITAFARMRITSSGRILMSGSTAGLPTDDTISGLQVAGTGLFSTLFASGVSNNLTATGSTQAGALALTRGINILGTVASGTGVVMPTIGSLVVAGTWLAIENNGLNAGKVYAAGSQTIDTIAGSTGITQAVGFGLYFANTASTWVSATLSGGGSGITNLVVNAPLTGGTITSTGTIDINIGGGLSDASGTVVADWRGGTVTSIGTGLTLSAGTISALVGDGLGINSGTVVAKNLIFGFPVSNTAGTISSAAFAIKGVKVSPSGTVTVKTLSLALDSIVNGASYAAFGVTMDALNVVTAVINSDTHVASGIVGEAFEFTLASNLVMLPGTNYALCVGRIDNTGSYALPINVAAGGVGFYPWSKKITSNIRVLGTTIINGDTLDASNSGVSLVGVSGWLGT